ncbi:MAG: FAD-binding and (Fe-S)-binding domain-containing protein [Planctomycetota bacterium]|nr:FAD-binding and (Fe-S)-binding domain-containing protein [Planctomycetota bacterium]MDA1106077.1 FAD-binding and (Fe-S)-binding domain-containing protein [Planctomycetota bacterium]
MSEPLEPSASTDHRGATGRSLVTPLPVLDQRQERERSAIAADLRGLTTGEVRFSLQDRMLYSTDASLYQVAPIGVVCPRVPEEAIEITRYCAARGIPILPRGGGTALAGQTVNTAVVLDFSQHCRTILSIDAERLRAQVQPGVVLDQLNAALAPTGLFFGPDVATSSHATIGGMIGNNSSGARSIRYGRTVENLHGLRAVTADGEARWFGLGLGGSEAPDPVTARWADGVWSIVDGLREEITRRFPKILRHVDGYALDLMLAQGDAAIASGRRPTEGMNLAHLLCGSEGTLATTLEAELRLVQRPTHVALAILAFPSVRDALAPITRMLALQPTAVELIDDVILELARGNRECATYLQVIPSIGSLPAGAVIYIEFSEFSQDALEARVEALRAAFSGVPTSLHRDAASMARAWALRKAGEPLLHGLPGHRKPLTFVEDTAVDPRRLPEFVEEFRAIVARHGTRAAYYAHASVGCLHIRPLVAIDDRQDREVLLSIATDIADLVIRYEGALSGEHGDGRVRSPLLSRVLGESVCDAIARVKMLFDPHSIMNPGNLVHTTDPRRVIDHLRVKPLESEVRVPEVSTFFRFEREGGFPHAATQCNGSGICRRLTPGGTMCPSYRVLLDERHSTRGRGNALRLAMSGQLSGDGAPAWNDPQTKETLSLCLSCKACTSECPSNVDMAKLKAEYTAQGFAERGSVPWRTRLLGRLRALNRAASAIAPLAEGLRQVPIVRLAISTLLGLDPHRSLPPVAGSLLRWQRRRRRSRAPQATSRGTPRVLLLADCFCTFSESRIGRAAIQLLERFGYEVELVDSGCCGRTLLSTGMLADAIHTCGATALQLDAAMQRTGAIALLAMEPSCASAIRDDWLDLRLAPDAARAASAVAAKTRLVEEFLDAQWDRHPVRPAFAQALPAVALHAHCHQKALWGAESSGGFLRRILGDRLETLATGCCGMAGAFGAQRETADLSRRIAENDLLPKVQARAGATICAPGASCRHQLHDLAAREALHPVELALALIDDRTWSAGTMNGP